MNKNIIIALVAGLVLGVVGTISVSAMTNNDAQETANTEQQSIDHSTMSMADMNRELENLTGDDYDKAFIEMMIAHHEGAVEMSELSADRAKHDEVKQLSQEIIAAQEQEIAEMKQWQRDWGYDGEEASHMMHGNH